MSIATVPLTPSPNVMSGLPRLLVHGATTAMDGVPREYEVLPRVAGAVANCAPKDVATEVADLLRPFAGFESLDIVAFEEDRAEVLWHSVTGTQLPPGDVPIEQTKMWWVYQHQQPLHIADWSRDDRFAVRRDALKRLGCAYQSLCCIPMRTSRQRLGVLRVASLRPNNFSEDQVRFLYSVADQLAVAMSESLSRKRLRRAESLLEVSNARFDLIMSVVNRAISAEEFGEVLIEVTTNTRRILDCGVALIALFDKEKGGLNIDAIEAVNPGSIADEEIRSKLTARLDRIMLSAEKGKTWTGRVEALDEIVSPAGTKPAEPTEACVIPILARGQVLGSMALARGQGESFTADEVAFVSHVATQLALAIEHAMVNRELQKLRQDFGQEKVHVKDEIPSEMSFEGIVGKSACLGRVLREVEIVAPTDSGVLILGETGTGKELIARAVHDRSSRRHQNFVKVNCAAIPSGLLESELFGHEKGAFTGAIMRKAGRFEVADRGTLFLDEVGDIPLDLQPKLLRVLQEHEFERLGSTRTQHVDVRVIAATHRNLKQMVDNGQFRSDLYYRLNIFPLTVPPLRDRAEDIPILVRYYVDKYARRMNRRIEEIPTAGMQALCRYSWPGNVRELQNFIERAVILSQGQVLLAPLSELEPSQKPKLGTLEDVEREHVLQALREAHWVIGGPNGAAALVGMKRTTLAYRIRKLKIPRKPW
jgi:formate hydrogenlyase transcriptional activator